MALNFDPLTVQVTVQLTVEGKDYKINKTDSCGYFKNTQHQTF